MIVTQIIYFKLKEKIFLKSWINYCNFKNWMFKQFYVQKLWFSGLCHYLGNSHPISMFWKGVLPPLLILFPANVYSSIKPIMAQVHRHLPLWQTLGWSSWVAVVSCQALHITNIWEVNQQVDLFLPLSFLSLLHLFIKVYIT